MKQPQYHPLTGLKIEPLWVSPSGREFWPIMGGDDTVPPAGGDGGGDGGDGGGEPKEPEGGKTLTQKEVSAIAAREKAEGKKAAERAIAEQLGVPVEEAAAIIKAARDAEDKTKSEAQRDREAAAKEKQEAEAEKAAAKEEVHQARLERAFAKEGFDNESDEEKTKRLLRLVTVEPGATYEEVLADVQQIKTDFPALFGGDAGEGGKGPKAPSGDPKGKPPTPTGGEDKFAKGAERAKKLYERPAFDPLAKK